MLISQLRVIFCSLFELNQRLRGLTGSQVHAACRAGQGGAATGGGRPRRQATEGAGEGWRFRHSSLRTRSGTSFSEAINAAVNSASRGKTSIAGNAACLRNL